MNSKFNTSFNLRKIVIFSILFILSKQNIHWWIPPLLMTCISGVSLHWIFIIYSFRSQTGSRDTFKCTTHPAYWLFRTFMCALALLSRPRVVWRLQSGPSGMRAFNRSRHSRRWARLHRKDRRKTNTRIRTMLESEELLPDGKHVACW